MRILVVDDDPNVRAFLDPVLVREGFEVECVDSGTAAIASVLDRRPDLVVLDVGLPDRRVFLVDSLLQHEWARECAARPNVAVVRNAGDVLVGLAHG